MDNGLISWEQFIKNDFLAIQQVIKARSKLNEDINKKMEEEQNRIQGKRKVKF